MLKPKRIKSEQITAIVNNYLKKRQYTQDVGDVAQKKDKKHHQGVEEMALSRAVTMETSLGHYMSLSSISGEANVCDLQYSKLRSFLSEAVEPYRGELQCLLYPLFVHVYLELLCSGHKTPAHKFYSRHHTAFTDISSAQKSILDELQQMYNKEDVAASSDVREFREHRYSINLSEESFQYLLRYLKTEEFLLLLQVFNKHFDFRVGRMESSCDPRQTDEKCEQMAPASPPCTPENKVIHNEATLSSLQQCIKKVRSGPPSVPSLCLYTVSNLPQGICCAALSSDNTNLLTGSEDSVLRVWSRNPELVKSEAATINTSHIHLSGDHPRDILHKHSDGTDTPREMAALRGHCGAVYGVSYTSDNNYILSVSEDMTARLWDVQTHTSRVVYRGHNYPVWCVDTSPLGGYFVTGSHDRTAKLWMTDYTFPLRTFLGHLSDVHVAKFHPNSTYIATGSSDRVVRLWSIQDGSPVRLLQGHKGAVYALAFSPDGKMLASAGEDRRIKIWDLGTGSLYKELCGHTDIVYSLSYNPESTVLVSGGMDGAIRVWNVEVNSATATTPANPNQELVSPELLQSFPVRAMTIHLLQYTRRNLCAAIAAPSN